MDRGGGMIVTYRTEIFCIASSFPLRVTYLCFSLLGGLLGYRNA
jgi:hypothetical protein